MKISITIMAHPKRKLQAETLLNTLKQYQFVATSITWDQINNEWHTGERSLRAGIGVGADWHIVIQDDAILPDDFYNLVENAIKYVPSRSLISFYTGKVRPLASRIEAAVNKAKYCRWLRGFMLFWGVAIAIPVDHIEPMLEYANQRQEPYDSRIGIFYQRNMLPVWYTMPSLVDHDDYIGSLLAHGQTPEPRVAHNFVNGPVVWNRDHVDI